VRRQCLRLLLYRICSSDRVRVSRARARSTRAAGSRAIEKGGCGGSGTHGVAGAEADPLRNLAVLLPGLGQGLLGADCTQERRPRTHSSARCPPPAQPRRPPAQRNLSGPALSHAWWAGIPTPQAHPRHPPPPRRGLAPAVPHLTGLVGRHLHKLRRLTPRTVGTAPQTETSEASEGPAR
jgi:hypothetical protein